MNSPASESRPIDIIVPFYRNASLVRPLFQSFEQATVPDELRQLHCSLIAINDSPEDEELSEALRQAVSRSPLPSELLENEQNLGFVQSSNRGLQVALERKHDAIILNSDTALHAGAIREMCEVAQLDPMIGFVSPRSNNATICSLPHQQQFRQKNPDESHALFAELSKYLPRFHFVPVGVGFCLLLRWEVLAEFGLFDESYGAGYNEENDLMMRANRAGYRAALANRAWVYHIGEASFSGSQFPKVTQNKKNELLLNERYPEYEPSLQRYVHGAHSEAEQVLTGLLPDGEGKLDLLFDFSSFGLYHNGTFVASKRVLESASRLWEQFNIHVMMAEAAWEFHGLDKIDRVQFFPVHGRRKFAAAFRFSQPFSLEQMFRLSRLAPVNVYGMFDPIAFDCLYLNDRNPDDLETLWSSVFAHADGVIYISDFGAELFQRRFPKRPGLAELVAYPSMDLRDYRSGAAPLSSTAGGQHILVVGNKFEHKRILATTAALSQAFPEEKIAVLGLRHEGGPNVISFESGNLNEAEMQKLLDGARFIVFPSTYEGFGLPVLESLAWRKPMLARSIPALRDIREKLGAEENLILYSSTRELIERLKLGFPEWRENATSENGDPAINWDTTSLEIGNFISNAISSFDFEKVLLPRIRHMHILGQHAERTGGPAVKLRGSDELVEMLEARDAQMKEIYASWSWRVTSPMRKAASAYLQKRRRDRFEVD
jgi:GT2 family glycosyltransferase